MSSSQIPNLNTLRSNRSAARGGRRLGGLSRVADQNDVGEAAKDKVVQQTDQDASVSRVSAVDVGYMEDAFAKAFVTGDTQRRYPIINRGTEGTSASMRA